MSFFKGKIVLGNNVVISPNAVIYGTGEVYIGDNSEIAPGAMVISQSNDKAKDIMKDKVHFKFCCGVPPRRSQLHPSSLDGARCGIPGRQPYPGCHFWLLLPDSMGIHDPLHPLI